MPLPDVACLIVGGVGWGAGRGDRERDGQAALVAGVGGDGAGVDRGNGRDDGEAESEAGKAPRRHQSALPPQPGDGQDLDCPA